MRYAILYSFILFSSVAFSQKHDNIWLIGYGGGNQSPPNDSFGLTIMRFDTNKMIIVNNQSSNLNFDAAISSLSDSLGNLLFYSNAERVYHRNHQLMQNGNNLNINNEYGSALPQAVLTLPFPNKKHKYLLLIMEHKNFGIGIGGTGYKIHSSIIDISLNNSLGQVIEKKNRDTA